MGKEQEIESCNGSTLETTRKMHSWNFLLLLALSLHLGVVLAVDYFCSFTYVGMCHQCPYQIELADCHYPATRTIYQNGKIYTVDPNDAQWET